MNPGRWASFWRGVWEFVLVWLLALVLIGLAVVAGCRADGWSRVAASTEVGVGSRAERALEEVDYVWLSVRPLAFMEPPQPVYTVPTPAEAHLSWQFPLASEEVVPAEKDPTKPWWWRQDEIRSLLGWVGAGIAGFALLLLGKLGLDKRAKKHSAS